MLAYTSCQGSLAWQAGGVLELRCISSFSVDVMIVCLWFWCGCFIMNGPFIWWVFCVPPPIRMLLLCTLLSTRLCVLSCQYQPFSLQATCFLHMQGDGFRRGQVIAKGERSKRVFIQYNRAQLLDMTPARLTPDLVSHLCSLQIGVDLPRKRSWCRGRRKQKQFKQVSHTPPSSLSLTERLISEDQDLVEDSRSDIPVQITNHTPTIHQSSVNFSNPISITTQDSHESTHQSQSCMKVLCFNAQSCQQIATDIHDMIVDTNVEVDGNVAIFPRWWGLHCCHDPSRLWLSFIPPRRI